MRILVVGGGGREHALCWKLASSPRVDQLFTAPGNPGTATLAKNKNVPIAANDLEALVGFASTEGIDLTVVGPEDPLAGGISNLFYERGLRLFGPSQAAAQLEASKTFAKEIMRDVGIPTAHFEVLRSAETARKYLDLAIYPIVLKADGLAAGKGVGICPNREVALEFVQNVMEAGLYGNAGKTIVAEEFLEGPEASFLVMADGTTYAPLAGSQDHKRLHERDEGPNTGGMGAYSPAPAFTSEIQKLAETKVVQPLLAEMRKRRTPFLGILYVGLVLTKEGPKVLEFNVRFGDPETQAILPRLESDLAELFDATVRGRLASVPPRWSAQSAMTVVLASDGYPAKPRKGVPISNIETASREALVFHAGTKEVNGQLLTNGGRVFGVTGIGDTLEAAAQQAYRAADLIQFESKILRRDIGWRALGRSDS